MEFEGGRDDLIDRIGWEAGVRVVVLGISIASGCDIGLHCLIECNM